MICLFNICIFDWLLVNHLLIQTTDTDKKLPKTNEQPTTAASEDGHYRKGKEKKRMPLNNTIGYESPNETKQVVEAE